MRWLIKLELRRVKKKRAFKDGTFERKFELFCGTFERKGMQIQEPSKISLLI